MLQRPGMVAAPTTTMADAHGTSAILNVRERDSTTR